jgi:hypothetical protein
MGYVKKLSAVVLNLMKRVLYEENYELLLFIHTLLILKIVQVLYKIKDFNYSFIVVLFVGGLIIYKLYSKFLTSNRRRIIFAILIFFLITSAAFIFRDYTVKYFNVLIEFYTSIQAAFYNSEDSYFYQYAPFLSVLLPIIIASALYLGSKGLENIVLLFSVIYIFSLWYATELHEVKTYVLAYIILASLFYGHGKFNSTSRKLEGEGIKLSVDFRKVFHNILILSFAVAIFTYLSVQIFGVKNIFVRVQERLEKSKILQEKSFNNRYDLSSSGYPDSSMKLGGPVQLNYDRVFTVQADAPYYLKGSVKEFYDGFKWEKTEDKYEKLSDVSIPFQSKSFQLGEARKLTVYLETLETSTLFTPSFTFNIILAKGQSGRDRSGNFMIIGAAEVSDSYTAEYFRLNSGEENFEKSYQNNKLIDYEVEDMIIKSRYSSYLQLPDNLSIETYSLVKDITKDCKNSSDKVEAIRNYLSETFKYSLNVSELPENKEFVDYFLFTEKKGYCTYFATAATILCRIAGVPARYVEGFNMAEKRNVQGLYDVTNDMAHAWTEILLSADEDIWSIVDAVPQAEKEELNQTQQEENKFNNKTENKSSGNKKQLNFFSGVSIKIISIWFLLLVTLCIMAYLILKIIMFNRLKKKILSSNSAVPLYYYIRNRIKFLYEANKVPEDDFLWIEKTADIELKEILNTLIAAVYDEFYGKNTEIVLDKYKVYSFIEGYLKNVQGRLKYCFYKFLNL